MAALTRERLGQFRVRFAELGRGVLDRFRPAEVVVDPFLVCRAVTEVMRQASMRSADGRLLVWNEYRVILAPADLEPLRALEVRLRRDLEAALSTEALRLEAEVVGDLRVHLVGDESGELRSGEAVIRAEFATQDRAPASDMTIRVSGRTIAGEIDRRGAPPVSTVRVPEQGELVVAWPGGAARLAAGARAILGRPHAAAPPHFVPLTGASTRISKQQLWVVPDPAGLTLGRFDGANPVEVAGAPITRGQEVRVTALPVEVALSRGELILVLSRG